MYLPHSTGSASQELWYVQLKPKTYHQQLINQLLKNQGVVRVEIEMEILEVDLSGRALVWIPDLQTRRKPRLGVVRLPESVKNQLASQRLNLQPVLKLTFSVLGEESPGVYGAVTSHPLGELHFKAPELERLEELIGADTNPSF